MLSNIAFCDEQKEEPIVCNGDKIEYIEGNKKLIGSGNMVITYRQMKMTADKVEVNLDTKEVYATGNVVLTEGPNMFKAESILYNFQQGKGKLINGTMQAPPWYGKCDEINRVTDTEYVLGTGYISTCDRIPPHYKIRTKQVKLYLGDKVEARNVVICAGNVPVMYLPVYTHSVKNKKPMVAVVPGHSKEWGYYNLAALRYNFKDQQQGKVHLDVRDKKGFASGITHNYSLNFLNPDEKTKGIELGSGIFDVYYMNEEDKNKPEGTQRERQRYRVMVRHKWQLDPKTLALAEYNKLTDRDFTKDYFYRQEYVNEIEPKTYVSLLRTEPGYSSGVLFQNRLNHFFTQTEYMPRAVIDIKNQRLFANSPLYYKGEYSAANLSKESANSDIDDDAGRLDGYNELSYVLSPAGPVCLNPYIGTRQSWYSKDKDGNEGQGRGILYTGIDASKKFHRTYGVESKFAGTEIHGLRHIVTPLARYKYIHRPSFPGERLANFDYIDTIDLKNALTLALENDLQTRTAKTQNGSNSNVSKNAKEDAYSAVDLARFIVSSDYNFQKTPGGEFSNIIGDLELRPSGRFLIESDVSFNPHSQKVDIANLDFVARRSDNAKIGLGHRYQKKESSEMTFDGLYPVTNKLGLHAYERYQFYGRDLKEQEYGLSYDLHCWTMDLNLNKSVASGGAVWVIFRLKAFPDFPVQLGSTYESPKPETAGSGELK